MTAGALLGRERLVVHLHTRTVERAAVGAVVALAAVLRLVAPTGTPLDPFYDAAVRSMGTSWQGRSRPPSRGSASFAFPSAS